MMTIYVLSGFNNYYNRIVKKFYTVEEYLPYELHTQKNFNFVPNDNVNTTVVLGNLGNQYTGEGDYLLVVNEFNEIVSRWFIIESMRDRAGQFTLTLHRDLVADHYDELLDAPVFIEKATLISSDPLIFNSENFSVNQIKKDEILLENNLKTPWVVAYLNRKDGEGNYNTFGGSFKYERGNLTPDYTVNALSDYPFNYFVNNEYYYTDNIDFMCAWYDVKGGRSYMQMVLDGPTGSFTPNRSYGYSPGYENWPRIPEWSHINNPICKDPIGTYKKLLDEYNKLNQTINGVQINSLSGVGNPEGFAILSAENGKIIKNQSNGKYYQIETKILISDYKFESEYQIQKGTDLYNKVLNSWAVPSEMSFWNGIANSELDTRVKLPFQMNKIVIELKELQATTDLTYNFSYNKAVTTDAVYEIIATPLYSKTFHLSNDLSITSIGDIGLQWFQAIANDNSTKVIDVQIVPYIPIDTADIYGKYDYITLGTSESQGANVLALAFKLPISSFNSVMDISSLVSLNDNVKVGSETELWRITSPNGMGSFDFNPYKNNGFQLVEVDCTLLPINPYIKINPLFDPNGLYGGDYNDFRGLICGGDFSVARTNSEWSTYQQQNKNFEAIFKRDLENMDVKNDIQRVQDIVGGLANVGTGVAGGMLAGSAIAPGVGTLVGGAIGGVASLAGGIGDYFTNEKLRNEAIDYTQDQWGYQLGNIKARSTALTKSTAYNINNKYFPYIEYFTCTDREKEAFANKIAWNGMTVMAIGKISDYTNNSWSYNNIESQGYIKGKLIRLETIKDDYHIINALSGELDKGVYIK